MRDMLFPERPDSTSTLVGKDARLDRGRGGHPGAAPHPRPARAVRPGVPEEPLAREKLCPVLGLVRVPDARRGIDAARAVLRIGGRRPLGRDPLQRPAHDHGLRRRRAGAAGRRQRRAAAPAQRGPRHQPGADDDDRHRLLRPVARWARTCEPQHLVNVDAAGLHPRPGRAVRRLHRPRAVAAPAAPSAAVPGGVNRGARRPQRPAATSGPLGHATEIRADVADPRGAARSWSRG